MNTDEWVQYLTNKVNECQREYRERARVGRRTNPAWRPEDTRNLGSECRKVCDPWIRELARLGHQIEPRSADRLECDVLQNVLTELPESTDNALRAILCGMIDRRLLAAAPRERT